MNTGGTDNSDRYGWTMVAVTFALTGLAFGGWGAVGVFLKPLIAEFGWTRGETSGGYTTMAVSSGLAGILWGMAADRFPLRWLSLTGLLSMVAALLLLGQMTALWQFYLFYFLFGAFGHGALVGPLYAATGHWFRRNPGFAMGVMTAGGAVGQGTVPFASRLLITEWGWQSAYMILGVAYLVIGLPLIFLVRESAARLRAISGQAALAGQSEDEFILSPREVISWLSVAVIFCCICMAVPIVQLVSLVSDRGVGPETSAGVLLALMTAGAFGRIIGGKLSDMIGILQAYLILSLGQAVIVVWFPHVTSVVGTYALAVLFGLIYSGVMANIVISLRVMVPARYAGTAMGIGGAFALSGMGFGGYFGGYLFDVTGTYVMSFSAAGAIGLINVVIISAFLARIKKQERALSLA
jgi:MFS family permease